MNQAWVYILERNDRGLTIGFTTSLKRLQEIKDQGLNLIYVKRFPDVLSALAQKALFARLGRDATLRLINHTKP